MDFHVKFDKQEREFDVSFHNVVVITTNPEDIEKYDGEYVITPSTNEQLLNTSNKMMKQDIIIRAIPKEYGLVTYDQNKVITIS